MKKAAWLVLSILLAAADQITKYYAEFYLSAYEPKPLTSMLNLTLAYNTGAAFSFLSGAGGWHRWFFALFSLLMSGVLFVWLWRFAAQARLQAFAVSLILGGALGNLYDRLKTGQVIDFIDVHYHHYHWPVFNAADSCICLGAILLLIGLCQNRIR